MTTPSFKLIGIFICCLQIVSAQIFLLREKTSKTPNDLGVHELTNLRGADSSGKYGNMMAVTAHLQQKNGQITIDQYSGTLTDDVKNFATTIAGSGDYGYNGDGIAATSAQTKFPFSVKIDVSGNTYFSDRVDQRVRKVTVSTGIITTIAGTGTLGYNGDGILATSAQINYPDGLDIDRSGNIYIADRENCRVRKVTASTGIITTVAGTGLNFYNGDGILATSAQLNYPGGVAVDNSGNVYISEIYHRVRKVTASTGIITTIAGTGIAGYNGDGILATSAQTNYPDGIAVDSSGNVYFNDLSNYRVRKVTVSTGIITTVAGIGSPGYTGDGILATNAEIMSSYDGAIDQSDNVYIADTYNGRIRKVTVSTGIITTVAGIGFPGFGGVSKTSVEIGYAYGVAIGESDNIYVAAGRRILLLTTLPTDAPSVAPTASPSASPSMAPSAPLIAIPSVAPTASPSAAPSTAPAPSPSAVPSVAPTASPSAAPSTAPAASPAVAPSVAPTASPSAASRSPIRNRPSRPSSAPNCKPRKPTPKCKTPPKCRTRNPSSRAAPRV